MTIYHTINWFFAFSFIGYLLECTVLSYENRRPVLNRGFGHGPFCVIYGFGALGACLILEPLAGQPVVLYFASVVMATSMELVTAHIMIKLFGALQPEAIQLQGHYLSGKQYCLGIFRIIFL